MPGVELSTETLTTERSTYTVAAPDTSLMTAVVESGIAVFTVGGLTLNATVDALPAFAALVATVAAQNPVTIEPASPPADTTDTTTEGAS